ncbi:predicted protein [Micromonas commoda]|uniref:Uncharacterized protein n=1 Tax=Micromonas commoda (strain RCC299 / NOUM17 / CCMP2709) TaxID=296587 RepID=C1FF74_MICCC|nr:predicted protein [Micromonas commoda]ACO68699.1 predicted protein [Micromonas commoda]|eukprot:XP_002507441.1 predicted protein [Micromonas commoda]
MAGDSRVSDDGVSESRKSDAPSPIAAAPTAATPSGGDRPPPGGDSPGGGGADPGADRSDPSAFETSIAKDAAALADALPPETADKVAKTSRRVAERRRRNTNAQGDKHGATATNGQSPPTPPSPRSPAVTWRVGARALPAPLRQPVFESGANPGEAGLGGASDLPAREVLGSAGFEPGTNVKSRAGAVFAVKAAEARAAAMAELAPAELGVSAMDASTSASTSASIQSASGAEARTPAAPKFLRGGDLYDYVPPERIVDPADDDLDDPDGSDDDDDWLRRGLTADSSDFDRTALTDGARPIGGRSESTNPDLSLTRSATAAIAREMTAGAGGRHRGDARSHGFYIRRSHPEGRAALAAALAAEESDLSDVASSVESLE